jgi:hypothetical protein
MSAQLGCPRRDVTVRAAPVPAGAAEITVEMVLAMEQKAVPLVLTIAEYAKFAGMAHVKEPKIVRRAKKIAEIVFLSVGTTNAKPEKKLALNAHQIAAETVLLCAEIISAMEQKTVLHVPKIADNVMIFV